MEDVFPPRRFLLEQNNLRNLRDENDQLRPSIHYNLSILRDMTLFTNTAHLDAAFDRLNSKSSVLDALVLIKVQNHRFQGLMMCVFLGSFGAGVIGWRPLMASMIPHGH